MPDRYDAIILGGGHDGLTCGAYLARAGLSTVVTCSGYVPDALTPTLTTDGS